MNDPRPLPWVSQRALIGLSSLTVIVLGFFAVQAGTPSPVLKDGIPIPFASHSALQGAVTLLDRRNGIDVYTVTFTGGEASAVFQQNKIYLVHIPNHESIVNAPLDHVIKEMTTQGHSVNFFGYRYSDASASSERRDISALRFKDRFPGQFFASAKARAQDALHGSTLTAFETANKVAFVPTDASATSARLDKSGSLYVFVVNEKDGALLSPRDAGVCGNGVPEGTEECDDGNQNDADLCTNACTKGIPVPFETTSVFPDAVSEYALTVSMLPVSEDESVVAGQTDVRLMSFDISAGSVPVTLSTIIAHAEEGNLSFGESYALYRDTDDDGIGDLKLMDGVVDEEENALSFHTTGQSQDLVLMPNQHTVFDIRADISATTTIGDTFRLGLKTDAVNAIYGVLRDEGTPVTGIRVDGDCLFFCSVDLTLVPGTTFDVQLTE